VGALRLPPCTARPRSMGSEPHLEASGSGPDAPTLEAAARSKGTAAQSKKEKSCAGSGRRAPCRSAGTCYVVAVESELSRKHKSVCVHCASRDCYRPGPHCGHVFGRGRGAQGDMKSASPASVCVVTSSRLATGSCTSMSTCVRSCGGRGSLHIVYFLIVIYLVAKLTNN